MESTEPQGVRARRPSAWALGFAALTILLRLPFLGMAFDPRDEGYYAAVAQSAGRGGRLYADLWYVRPPFLNLVYGWSYLFSLATRMPYDVAVRLLSALFAAATVGVLARVMFGEFSVRAAMVGSGAATLMAASLALQNEANAETWMMLPYTLSALLVLHVALRGPGARRALWTMALGGVVTGTAAAFKQVALVNLALPLVAWAVFDPGHARRWLARTAVFAAGVLAVWVAMIVGIAMTDDVRAFLYYAWFRNAVYIRDSHAGADALRVLVTSLGGSLLAFALFAVVVLALFAVSLSRRDGSSRQKQIGLFAFGWLCISAVGIAASGRFYPHYFIQATAPLALLLTASTDAMLRGPERTRGSAVRVAAIALLALSLPLLSWATDLRAAPAVAAQRQVYKNLGEQQLPHLTKKGGTFLLWGVGVSVRAYSLVTSASRLPVVAYDYGWTPTDAGTFLGENFPSTAEVALAEIDHTPPDTIVLTVPLNQPSASSPRNDGVRLTAALYSLAAEHYKVVDRGDGYVVLKRKS